MKFEEALPALKSGKKIKRNEWNDDFYLSIASLTYPIANVILIWTNNKSICDSDVVKRDGEYFGVRWITANFDILFDDWEIISDV
jgi:hypothetical protein